MRMGCLALRMWIISQLSQVVKLDLLHLLLSTLTLDSLVNRLAFLFRVPYPVHALFVVGVGHMAQLTRRIIEHARFGRSVVSN